MAGLIVGLLLQQVTIFWLSSETVAHVEVAPHYRIVTRRGDFVSLDFQIDKARDCVTETSRWLWRDEPDGRRVVVPWTQAMHSFGHDRPEPRAYQFLYPIPLYMPEGEWNVRTLHADYCWPWSYMIGPRLRSGLPFGVTVQG